MLRRCQDCTKGSKRNKRIKATKKLRKGGILSRCRLEYLENEGVSIKCAIIDDKV